MKISNEELKKGIERIGSLNRTKLPSWNELPNIELYMDQVIALVNRYLGFFAAYDGDEGGVITHSMINNYVKQRIIPTPVKKRYGRTHLACLIMIGTLKQSLSISTIEVMLPNDCDEEQAQATYESFVESWDNSLSMAADMIEEQLKLFAERKQYEDIRDIAADMAVSSNIFKVLTEKLIGLNPKSGEDENAKQKSKKNDKKKTEEQ